MAFETGGNSEGTSPLTLDAAASRIESLLSDDSEETQDRETPREAEASKEDAAPEPDSDEQPEQPAEEEESEAADEEHEEEQEQPQTFKVKVNGQDLEVTLDELLNGYSRTQDYTRKTQEVAEARKKFETEELAAVRTERQTYATQLAQVAEALKSLAGQEPDWAKLRAESPEEYLLARDEWNLHQERLRAVEAERQETLRKIEEDQTKQRSQILQAEKAKLVEAIPAWKDAAVAKKERAEMIEYAGTLGFTPEAIAEVSDHRALVMLRKAMLFDKAAKAKPIVQQKIEKAKVAAPGAAPSTRPKVSEVTRAKQRLAKTGRVDDAARAIELILGG